MAVGTMNIANEVHSRAKSRIISFWALEQTVVTNSSDVFTIFFTNYFHDFFSVWTVEKEEKIIIGAKVNSVQEACA